MNSNEEREDEWLWNFMKLHTDLMNAEIRPGRTKKEVMDAYLKKEEGVDKAAAIARWANGLKEKHNIQ